MGQNLTRKILNFSCDRHIEGWSGRRLAPLFRECGIANVCVQAMVIMDDASQGLEWVTFLHQRAELAVSGGRVSEREAASWREEIDQAVALQRYFFSLTQFVVWGDVR